MSHFDDLFVVRTILPNTSGAYLLRVFVDFEQRFSILGWKVVWSREKLNTPTRFRRTTESSYSVPIIIEDDHENDFGAKDLIVDSGRWILVEDRDFENAVDAITYCRELLRGELT